MSVLKSNSGHRGASRLPPTTGRLRNEHFLLLADHLSLEVSPSGSQLVSATAEGNVEVRMLGGAEGTEYVVHASSAVFQAGLRRLVLQGTRENGMDHPPKSPWNEVVLPTDGTFFHAGSTNGDRLMAENVSPAREAA